MAKYTAEKTSSCPRQSLHLDPTRRERGSKAYSLYSNKAYRLYSNRARSDSPSPHPPLSPLSISLRVAAEECGNELF